MKIAVFASTNGTDFQAILDEMEENKLPGVEVSFLLTNKKNSGAIEKAEKCGIPVKYISGKDKEREDYDREVDSVCEEYGVDLICLVGWMRLFSPWFVKKYEKKIINVHPSLLPKYPGMDLNVHQEVLDNKEKETGMTIHYVDEGMDSGPIILQKSLLVREDDSAESLKARVQELEKMWYPEVIRMIQKERDL